MRNRAAASSNTSYRTAASPLSADFAGLGAEVSSAIAAGADGIHFDVMDNHYVPNLTMDPLVCAAIRPHTSACIDVHLMIKPVDRIIPDFAKAGANRISFHPEASEHIDHVLYKLDMVTIMSVNPGFGGQTFIPEALYRIGQARQRIDQHRQLTGHAADLEVDGGIKVHNIRAIAEAGAKVFVAGSAIFGSEDYAATVAAMHAAIRGFQKEGRRLIGKRPR